MQSRHVGVPCLAAVRPVIGSAVVPGKRAGQNLLS